MTKSKIIFRVFLPFKMLFKESLFFQKDDGYSYLDSGPFALTFEVSESRYYKCVISTLC